MCAASYNDINARMTYGTDCANAYKILEDTLNLRDVRIYDTVRDADGKEKESKLFPGYVLVKMIMTDETWYVVRNARGVTGFVGPSSKPIPLSEEEVEKLGVETPVRSAPLAYKVGDNVQITGGPLEGFIGIVESIDEKQKKVNVKVSMFGRETPAELEFTQIKPLD